MEKSTEKPVQKFKQIGKDRYFDYDEAKLEATKKFLSLTKLKDVPENGMQDDEHKVRVRCSVKGGIASFNVVSYGLVKKNEEEKPATKARKS
jgi:hypothetical protein